MLKLVIKPIKIVLWNLKQSLCYDFLQKANAKACKNKRQQTLIRTWLSLWIKYWTKI